MGKFYFDAELCKLSSRGCADIFRSCVIRGLMILAGSVLLPVCAQGAYTVDESGKTSPISSLEDLQAALADVKVATVVLAPPAESSDGYKKDPQAALVLPDGTVLKSEGERKVVQVVEPFLPEDGSVRIGGSGNGTYIESPAQGAYSEYCLFHIEEGSKVSIDNLTLMGGFTGSRTVADKPSVGGIDNYGYLEMQDVDMLRTGTALLNRPGSRVLLVHCNIVRNANWYGGGILNFAEAKSTSSGTVYSNGGTLVMDCCSLTENESLGPQHGGGAAENQGLMCLNNCVVANNASTEIGGGINNCKGGELFVMNSTFTGNITTSASYETDAGGAIGNAGGASHVHIVNSILAYNGYDDGTSVTPSSLGRYSESEEVACSLLYSVYDAMSGMPTAIEDTGTTKNYTGLFNGFDSDGIIAAGATKTDGKTSAFDHPLVGSSDSNGNKWALEPVMTGQPEDHYVFRNAVTTYFDYSKIFEGDKPVIGMAYKDGENIVAMGEGDVVVAPGAETQVKTTFSGQAREPNFIGASAVTQKSVDDTKPEVTLFSVKLGDFTGGRVSGVTVYGDSYRSNTVVTVHGYPDSAHYLDGWIINNVKQPGSEQQYIYSFPVTTNITITPIFTPVETKIIRVRQRYPWNNLVDIDYSVAEKDAIDYRLVFVASFVTNGVPVRMQLKSFIDNTGKNAQGGYTPQRLGEKRDLRKAGEHRATWDSAADGVRLKDGEFSIQLMACEGDER